MSKDCEICRRIKNNKKVFIYEDDYVKAYLSEKQVSYGKTTVCYKKHVTKFTELSKKERINLLDSVMKVANILERTLKPDHMNYMLLGNYHKHLHWHLVPRYEDKEKDAFYFKEVGLEYPILGRRIHGRYEVSEKELKKIVKKISF